MEPNVDDRDEWQPIKAVRARFPNEAEATDIWVRERGYESPYENPYACLESFADRTTEAIFAKDSASVSAHTAFIADWYLRGPEAIRQLVDVYYAEPLMWNASNEQKRWAWDFIAAPVRSLYEDMWGAPEA
ncbi:DUF7674 family protein [Montanilutibacter psychrotolerans]|uniref:DUF7674 family protein n=1 Tax=Montanilutibacter psychrotolerans TaxID=1327343 RepID=UPI0011CE9F89|nr:hypothetical protein [Lysobacter psychrotolerans]